MLTRVNMALSVSAAESYAQIGGPVASRVLTNGNMRAGMGASCVVGTTGDGAIRVALSI